MVDRENMSSTVTVKTLASNLRSNVVDELGMYLNPRMPLKDFRTLAGKLGYTFMRVRNFERERNPTASILEDWWTSFGKKGEAKTVADIISVLEEMKRDDAVDLLKPYEFTEIELRPPGQTHQQPKLMPSPFYTYSRNDLQETRFPEENELPLNNSHADAPEAVVSGVQNRIENYIHPGSESESRSQGRHPAMLEQHNTRTQNHRNNQPPVTQGNTSNPCAENANAAPVYSRPGGVEMSVPRPVEPPVVSDKVALVIGNKNYQCERLRGLFYPERDAEEVARALCELGFKVVSLVNLTLSEMRIAVLSFCRLLGKNVYAVLYYGGHGYEDSGKNYLLPVDADLQYKREDSLCAQEILQTMQECDTALNLLIIDSCRIRLPDRGSRPTFVKRGAKGNNIFAYSCCSEQEAHEERDQENGLYAQHLLSHIRRSVRVENILMDVARDVSFSNNHYINQRPCHESDAYLDCRLTDPICPGVLPHEFQERVELWKKAHMLPKTFVVQETDQLHLVAEFRANFSNVMEVMVIASNKTPYPLTRFVMDLRVPTPVRAEVGMLSGDVLEPNGQLRQVFKLSALQKLLDKLITDLHVYYYVNGRTLEIQQAINLGCPLVSSVFTEWDWWVTCGRAPPTKSTQV